MEDGDQQVIKESEIPPCSKCGNIQKPYEKFIRLDAQQILYGNKFNLNSVLYSGNPPSFFLCQYCYEEMFNNLVKYTEEIKKEWVPK